MLTGKRRYRIGGLRRNKLILQVQVRSFDMIGPFAEPVAIWRDARVEDLMTIEATHRPLPVEGAE